MTRPRSPVIDVWANWWPRSFFDAAPMLADLYRRLKFDTRMDLSLEDIAAEADAAGVDKIILSATAFPGSPATNAALHEIVAANPALLSGCASVDPRTGMAGVRELRTAVEDYGFIGLKLLPFLCGEPPNHAIYFPLYTACVDLGIPVLILTGHTAVAMPNRAGHPRALDDVALHFPELTIIAGHGGYPWANELVALAWKHENLVIETSGHLPKYLPPELVRYMNSYGKSKVLFGTGYPMMDYQAPLSQVPALQLKPEAEAGYLGGNARRIWPNLLAG